MSATLTIGKRRAGIPSERGSIEISLVGLRSRNIGEIADALRETATFTYRLVSYWLPIPMGGIA
jgi:uncharacterized membrane protein YbhN (UPF0104 family)